MKNRIEAKIAAIMANPKEASPLSAAGLLQAASRLFEGLVTLRAAGYRKGLLKTHRLPCIVISIGNITSGGTGKTPMTLYVARLVRQLGYKTVIISRGYKGGAEKTGGIVSDGKRLLMTPAAAGDEPFMMATFLKDVPVLVGRDRVSSGHLAVSRFSPDIVLLDDGFQHRQLHRDIDIVLLDSARPLGNAFLLPRGSLREPAGALSRADTLIFTRWHDNLPSPEAMLPEAARKPPVFRSCHVPYVYSSAPAYLGAIGVSSERDRKDDLSRLTGARVFAFSAIADNADFHRVLTTLGCRMVGTAEFSDHHAFSPRELEDIGRQAAASGAELLVTTQKDVTKLPGDTSWPLPLVVLGVLPSFTGEENRFDNFLKSAIEMAAATAAAPLRVTAFLDGRTGHEKQTRGILQALSRLTPIQVTYLSIGPLSTTVPVRQWLAYLRLKPRRSRRNGVAESPVDLIIGTGTHTHIPMLLLKRSTGAPVVTCMGPAAPLKKKIDLCFIPTHDRPAPARNMVTTLGPPNLSEAGNSQIPGRHLILVGGRDEKSHFWNTERLIRQIGALLTETPATWTIAASPRTPEETTRRLSRLADETPKVSFFRFTDTPPGWIETAYAEHGIVWVTADSMSMVYEALSAGCRVGILPVRWKRQKNKFQRSIDDLVQNRYAVVFTSDRKPAPPAAPAPLDEASRCAREILKRWWPGRLPVGLAESPE